MRAPKIHMINPNKLKPWELNPRINEDAIEEVAKSIKEFGFNQPLLINDKNVICVGHTRREAAILLGLDEIPCIKKKMSEDQFIKYNLSDNKTGEISEWDDDQLKALLLTVEIPEVPGFDEKEIADILGEFDEDQEKDSSDGQSDGSKRTSKDATKMVFNCTAKQMMEIDSKLDGIVREQNLDNQVEALLFALKGFKGNVKVKRVRRS